MLNNYDRIARTYDRLSRLIFGKSIVRAQQALLPHIKPGSRVLVVGGGTGWILEEMAGIHPSGLTIDYVEISANMLELARKRHFRHNRVTFVHASIEDYPAPEQYDVIMTPFLFDNFSPVRAQAVFQKLNDSLKNGALWLFTDFHIDKNLNRIWQKALLRSMYIFFRNISQVEADQLPDMQSLFRAENFQVVSETFHFGRFIHSVAYRKSGDGGAAPTEDKPLVEHDDREQDQ
jgi:ubiquinone/menaquinone biosynthesis C-methylase UbiE